MACQRIWCEQSSPPERRADKRKVKPGGSPYAADGVAPPRREHLEALIEAVPDGGDPLRAGWKASIRQPWFRRALCFIRGRTAATRSGRVPEAAPFGAEPGSRHAPSMC